MGRAAHLASHLLTELRTRGARAGDVVFYCGGACEAAMDVLSEAERPEYESMTGIISRSVCWNIKPLAEHQNVLNVVGVGIVQVNP